MAQDIQELRTRAERRDAPTSMGALHDGIEDRLHGGIVASLGNQTIRKIHKTNMDRFRLMRPQSGTLSHDHFITASVEHSAIIEAAKARDVQAARDALRQHIAASLQRSIMSDLFTV
ncbi:FCD domain-containing protein [Devosia algicola]|uniref:FCD domain-containing protein n=1 Tax=Devosia algicola TaxID=3026418 RepID=A0ABY7YPW7_9HYPH|nr:FCD domain-containing protein [Devosia algicola]WDR03084.1 FCD domain-containing protein [Devosia algicola]